MDIQVNYEYGEEIVSPFPLVALAEFVARRQGLPENTEASITFVDDETIARLNSEYRGKSGPTDVLSFECDGIDDDFSSVEADEPYELGDIVIAVDVAKRQTAEFGTTFEEELSLLIVHGMLHLCGYDHLEDEEAEVMEALEREILAAWDVEHSK